MKQRGLRILLQGLVILIGATAIGILLFKVYGEKEEKKNILLIVADTLRTDHLGCYGYDKPLSPNIDKLAASGMTFERFYTVAPSTLASFTSLMTSRYPKDHGAFRNGFRGHDDLPVLGEALKDEGYDTAAFIASYCLSKRFGMGKGFDLYDARFTSFNRSVPETIYRGAKGVSNSFLQWAKTRESSDPFFVMLHYFDPHWPYDPPEPYMEMMGVKTMAQYDALHPDEVPKGEVKTPPPSGRAPTPREKNFHGLYCAEIRYMDAQIGRVLNYLNRAELLKDTIVIFTADHGETFWEHDDLFNHGLYVYDTTIRSPLVMSCPGLIPEGARSDELLCTLDLAPTICRLCGAEPYEGFEGQSFMDRILQAGAPIKRDPIFFSEATMPYEAEKDAIRPNMKKAKSICYGPWKYVIYPFIPGRKELYHLLDDPMEKTNLIARPENAELIKKLDALLSKWASKFRSRKGLSSALDQEVQNKLKGIGY